jgi:alkanesulfonate monooxygenase SsuD/methylene tetrahydromethanopterin reductase-like flavin-dependent oxidoreductase (luciferase family)
MKFGFQGTQFFSDPADKLVNAAVEAEKFGYDSFIISDHTFHQHETWNLAAYLAAKTTRIKFGTSVTAVPRYVPAVLARRIAHVDVLSKGRVIAGALGTGYNWTEFRNFTQNGVYPTRRERVEMCAEAIALMIKLWAASHMPSTVEAARRMVGSGVDFHGKYYSVMDCNLVPAPVQKPYPPVWYGGTGNLALKTIVAKYCDGWICPTYGWVGVPTVEGYEAKMKRIQKYAKEYNKDMSKFTWGAISPETNVEKIEEFRAVGCQYYIFTSGGFEGIQKFAKEIIPSFQ